MPCPGQDELTRFLVGDLPRPMFQRLLEHVEGCTACTGTLQALDEPADMLVASLQGVGVLEEEADEDEAQRSQLGRDRLLQPNQACHHHEGDQKPGEGQGWTVQTGGDPHQPPGSESD